MMGEGVHVRATEILARGKGIAKKVTFDYRAHDGKTVVNTREVYEIDDAVAVIPFDQERGTVLLTRQFRLPAWLRGHRGDLIEACAGKLEGEDPQTRILHEAEEELGYRLHDLQKAFDLFSSPGNTTEKVSCYLALYSPANKVSEGGGLHEEGEHIEVLELPLQGAFNMVETGAIRDAKTVALLQHAQLRFAKSAVAPAFSSGR